MPGCAIRSYRQRRGRSVGASGATAEESPPFQKLDLRPEPPSPAKAAAARPANPPAPQGTEHQASPRTTSGRGTSARNSPGTETIRNCIELVQSAELLWEVGNGPSTGDRPPGAGKPGGLRKPGCSLSGLAAALGAEL